MYSIWVYIFPLFLTLNICITLSLKVSQAMTDSGNIQWKGPEVHGPAPHLTGEKPEPQGGDPICPHSFAHIHLPSQQKRQEKNFCLL